MAFSLQAKCLTSLFFISQGGQDESSLLLSSHLMSGTTAY